ncbi:MULTISPECIES: GIY-YIG nuclease family protein [Nostocaceae]|uniref:GIY-YIG nuclease family protein n=1 Tax=Nostocaceae TaxID=1162 RepID=UPI001CCFA179|nr:MULTISPECIES: GIY-YIG nuclease family protein [Nostocaceae]
MLSIQDVSSGKTLLKCPYCQGDLIAKKGKVKQHHFAHDQETCHPVAKRKFPTLPLYDNFNIELALKDLKQLKLLWSEYGAKNYPINYDLTSPGLLKSGVLRKNIYLNSPGYEFSDLGKIPVGALDFQRFNEIQEPLILKKLLKLELALQHAQHKNASDLEYRLTDLKLYYAQVKRILSSTLYFLEIISDKGTFYKIGVTARPVIERVAEVERDLVPHYGTVAIKVLGSWAHRGNIELYFKHRYQKFNYPIEILTEYFNFTAEDMGIVLSDLQRMQPKTLSQLEMAIFEENVSFKQIAI